MQIESTVPDPRRLLPRTLEDRLLGLVGRAAGLVLCSGVAAAWLALLTWTVTDPSLTNATGGQIANLLASPGAIFSDLLLQTLGFSAVLALLAPTFWGIELACWERIADFRTKACLYPVSVLALAGAASSLPTSSRWPLHHGFGGILGDFIYNVSAGLLGSVNPERAGAATGLFFFAAGLAALTHSVGLSVGDIGRAPSHRGAMPTLAGSPRREVASRGLRGFARALAGRLRSNPATPAGPDLDPGFSASEANGDRIGQWQSQPFARQPMPETDGHHGHPATGHGEGYPDGRAPAPEHRPHAWDLPPQPRAYAHPGLPTPAPYHDEAVTGSAEPFHAQPRAPAPDPSRREPMFDASTDRGSRAIAERFAPPMAEPSGRGRRIGGLLAGLGLGGRKPAGYKRPSLNLLKRAAGARPGPEFTQSVLRGNARLLEDVLADFGIKGEVKNIRPGPIVTLYELEPARGTKSTRVIGLADDIARSMSATAVRVAVVPGRNAIGIELPNLRRETVLLREILESEAFRSAEPTLPLALGRGIGGEPVVVDLARMPHLLVAGTTGSGKSVGINGMIVSLLYRHAPEDCRFLMIDPKMLELSVYNGIPHLLTPVVTDPHKAVAALEWAVGEMEERYKRMAALGVRNIDVYNNRVRNARKRGEMLARTVQTGFDPRTGEAVYVKQELATEPLPFIVVVVDEFADLMVQAGKEIETLVQRLTQMARAAGIHLIMATQRPSVDIVTGTIKANFPTRIGFKVASKIDSRTILNEAGAEQLLGQGDMLVSNGAGQIVRVHGAFVADDEVESIVAALRQQGEPDYVDGITEAAPAAVAAADRPRGSEDDLYDRAVAIVTRDRKASTSYIQRRLSIGYNRAADLIERMQRDGIVGPADNVGRREIMAGGGSAGETAA